VGIHGANRLGSNSLTELIVFGKVAGDEAAAYAKRTAYGNAATVRDLANKAQAAAEAVKTNRPSAGSTERIATIRKEMARSMEDGCGIYRSADTLQATCDKLGELKQRYKNVKLDDQSKAWNTEWLLGVELGYLIDVSQAMAHSALQRQESRGSHQRLDGFDARDDIKFLQHSLAYFAGDAAPDIRYGAVKITSSAPGTRAYGAAGEQADADRKAKEANHG
jgi:fumarate reductase flavoprotein subunit